MKISHLSTPDEVARFAAEGNHTQLYACIRMYRLGQLTWDQAMQIAAISQARKIEELTISTIDLLNRQSYQHGIIVTKYKNR